MAFEGMDVEAAQAVVQQINGTKDDFATLISRMTTAVQGINWTGPDQTMYVNEWQSQSQSLLNGINQFIDSMATKLNFNISQQTSASAN